MAKVKTKAQSGPKEYILLGGIAEVTPHGSDAPVRFVFSPGRETVVVSEQPLDTLFPNSFQLKGLAAPGAEQFHPAARVAEGPLSRLPQSVADIRRRSMEHQEEAGEEPDEDGDEGLGVTASEAAGPEGGDDEEGAEGAEAEDDEEGAEAEGEEGGPEDVTEDFPKAEKAGATVSKTGGGFAVKVKGIKGEKEFKTAKEVNTYLAAKAKK